MDMPERLKTSEAARYVGVAPRTLVAYVNAGRVRAYRFSERKLLFDRSALDEFLEGISTSSAGGGGK